MSMHRRPSKLPGLVLIADMLRVRGLQHVAGHGSTFLEMKVGCDSSVAASRFTMSLNDSLEARACTCTSSSQLAWDCPLCHRLSGCISYHTIPSRGQASDQPQVAGRDVVFVSLSLSAICRCKHQDVCPSQWPTTSHQIPDSCIVGWRLVKGRMRGKENAKGCTPPLTVWRAC